ncbi:MULTISPECIES: hypothetical protein [Pseudomonas]|uniref:hypothetical protein n=1 Tax=Pseudomonas TaxID=286 RepID=UPI001FF1A294|nr:MULTISPECIES: hypothetical protein [Pseudomonas]
MNRLLPHILIHQIIQNRQLIGRLPFAKMLAAFHIYFSNIAARITDHGPFPPQRRIFDERLLSGWLAAGQRGNRNDEESFSRWENLKMATSIIWRRSRLRSKLLPVQRSPVAH